MPTFHTIVADPPWPIRWSGGGSYRVKPGGGRWHNPKFKRKLPYPTMAIGDICALRVDLLAARHAHLYLWAPDPFILNGAAMAVARAWGFEPLRFLVWAKRGLGLGKFPRPQHECVLVCRRGKLPFLVDDVGSVQVWKMPYAKSGGSYGRVHSQKPDEFLELVERASPGPRIELFARRARAGWDRWGNEVECSVGLSGAVSSLPLYKEEVL